MFFIEDLWKYILEFLIHDIKKGKHMQISLQNIRFQTVMNEFKALHYPQRSQHIQLIFGSVKNRNIIKMIYFLKHTKHTIIEWIPRIDYRRAKKQYVSQYLHYTFFRKDHNVPFIYMVRT
jgi:hypothetical protein